MNEYAVSVNIDLFIVAETEEDAKAQARVKFLDLLSAANASDFLDTEEA